MTTRNWMLGMMLSILIAPAAMAAVNVLEWNNIVVGATELNWTCALEEDDYICGDPLIATVQWEVVTGAAEYDDFALRHSCYTPRSWRDPAIGTEVTATYVSGAEVEIDFAFCDLKTKMNDEYGKGHFHLFLQVDEDGDGTVETTVGLGVNVEAIDVVGGRCPGLANPAICEEAQCPHAPTRLQNRAGHLGTRW
jgi:hypothetical protein